MSYRAIVCADWGLPETLQLREHAAAPPGPGQLAIDVHCCGVNFPDFLMIQGKYQVGGDDSSDAARTTTGIQTRQRAHRMRRTAMPRTVMEMAERSVVA